MKNVFRKKIGHWWQFAIIILLGIIFIVYFGKIPDDARLAQRVYAIKGIYAFQNVKRTEAFTLVDLVEYIQSKNQNKQSEIKYLEDYNFRFPFDRKDILLMLDKKKNAFCIFYEPEDLKKLPENNLGRLKSECFVNGKT